ncbi:hypothetical protein [Hydrogenovibrio halophilus]|uniref:hypothetical protein n=1 Tax=Hydrogenovibrio halophilus TaxID=373391 RepID=UPI0012FD0CA7|nr:hypothetical protein [Hydrogenovibrio halophilus]
MKYATPEQTALRVKQHNEQQRAIKRDKPYIPLEIPAGIDTSGKEWQLHCLAMNILNEPTSAKREARINELKVKNPRLYDELLPKMKELKERFWVSGLEAGLENHSSH